MPMKGNTHSRRFIKGFQRVIIQVLLLTGIGCIGKGFAVEPVTVEFIEGNVFVITGEAPEQKVPLTKTYSLQPGQRIQTEPGGTVELLFPDTVILRVGSSSSVRLFPAKGKTGQPASSIPAVLLAGEAWVNVTALKRENPVGIATGTCLLETDTGVFRVILHLDQAVEIKDYHGSLKVSGPLDPALQSPLQASTDTDSQPAPAAPSSRKWEQELRPFTKMVVWRPAGRIAKPFRFAAKADQTKWVLWNQARDKRRAKQP